MVSGGVLGSGVLLFVFLCLRLGLTIRNLPYDLRKYLERRGQSSTPV